MGDAEIKLISDFIAEQRDTNKELYDILKGKNGDPGICEGQRKISDKVQELIDENALAHASINNKLLKKDEDIIRLRGEFDTKIANTKRDLEIKIAENGIMGTLSKGAKILFWCKKIIIGIGQTVLSLAFSITALYLIFHKQFAELAALLGKGTP